MLIDLEDRYGIKGGAAVFDQRLLNVIEVAVQECYDQYAEEIFQRIEEPCWNRLTRLKQTP